MAQLKSSCGYVIPALEQALQNFAKDNEGIQKGQIAALLAHLSSFEADATFPIDQLPEKQDAVLMVLHNLFTRGMPTHLPWGIEEEIGERLGGLSKSEERGNLFHDTGQLTKEDLGLFWRALHIIDPRLDRKDLKIAYQQSWEELDSGCEEDFWFKRIPEGMGNEPWYTQLFEPQRSLTTMVEEGGIPALLRHNFTEQRADFVLELPYHCKGHEYRGVCIEVDGPHHKALGQQQLDTQRDDAIHHSQWLRTFRFPTSQIGKTSFHQEFRDLRGKVEKHHFLQYVRKNYHSPLYESGEGLRALQYALTPFGVARIQLILLRAIMAGVLSLDADSWSLAVLERDIPCAQLTVNNFRSFLSNLFLLEGKGRIAPEIKLQVYCSPEFINCELHQGQQVLPVTDLAEDSYRYDLFIDISLLMRGVRLRSLVKVSADQVVTIRSAYQVHKPAPVMCGKRIDWRAVWEQEEKQPHPLAEKALSFLLQQVFRKKAFRTGQLPILHHALKNRTVIGLLPTGGGKSLAYQVASLLQPGLTLVIDPIKSLMKDQVDSLVRSGINRMVFINSSLSRKEKEVALQRFEEGQAQLCFVSPERMQMVDFRNILASMYDEGRYFAYAVIDEVHCVSEWGHDFRTSYLFLGANLLQHCRSYQGKVALFGLTATASFDVLADVQRELGGNDPKNEIPDEQIVRHETTNRDEIQFIVEEVNIDDAILDEVGGPNLDEWRIKEALGRTKRIAIEKWLGELGDRMPYFNETPAAVISQELVELTYEGDNKPTQEEIFNNIRLAEIAQPFWQNNGCNAGIIFTPHRSWYFGVTDKYGNPGRAAGIYDYLTTKLPKVRFGTYMGAKQDEEGGTHISSRVDKDNFDNQEKFLANDIDLMVCTKAFGMGIDKPNIRFTLHLSYPSSIESFVQEAGRAGRDRKLALAVLLYNKQTFDFYNGIVEPDYDIQNFFHNNSFRGVAKEYTMLHELLSWVRWPSNTHPEGGEAGIEKKLVKMDIGAEKEQIIPFFSPKTDPLLFVGEAHEMLTQLEEGISEHRVRTTLQSFVHNKTEINAYNILQAIGPHQKWQANEWREKVAERDAREGKPPGDFMHQLDLLFSGDRNKSDTEKALYRLSLIGVVDTYTVDYNQKTFTVAYTKKEEAQYLEHFRHYLNKFYPTNKVEKAVDSLVQRSEHTLIRRMLGYLLEFAYDQIARKRREGIKTMKEFCELGLKYSDKGQANREMKAFIHLYFNSKYARSDYQLVLDDPEAVAAYRSLPSQQERFELSDATYNLSLQDWTDGGKEAHIDWVFDFMQITLDDYQNTPVENLKHLRGATTRLLILNPDNYTCRLLRAYTNAVLAERLPDQSSLPTDSILEDMRMGITAWAQEVSSRETLVAEMQNYLQEILIQLDENKEQYHEFVANIWEQAMLFTHLAWTQRFAHEYAQVVQSITIPR